ncbi:hypothetical protein [Candidatus Odyssella acanthamoebae]|uniref:Uncharacterized protein n=1 Tax=Candidatus Odyssella acanthamoebae TaxID=91604 RepID=A0A077ASK7_9PROT|nr:hypothetical protein [Candidatus Paracaedibacter acanthamoebae]AIK96182.1 hypothetical protein ID47_04635 [Candidatus Paracaedibacter acanthamoebae]
MKKPLIAGYYLKNSVGAAALIIANFDLGMANDIAKFPEDERGQSSYQDTESDISFSDLNYKKIFQLRPKDFSNITIFSNKEEDDVIHLAQLFFFHTMAEPDRIKFLNCIRGFSPADRETIINFAESLLLPIILYGFDCLNLIEIIKDIPGEERETILRLARPLYTYINGLGIEDLIRIIQALPVDERESLVYYAKILIDREMGILDGRRIIRAIQKIPQDDRANIVNHTKNLLLLTGLYDIKNILQTIKGIPLDERENIVNHLRTFITETQAIPYLNELIEAIRETAADDREPVLNYAKTLITQAMDGYECSAIIEAIRETASDDSEPVLNHARTLITETMDGYECSAIIEAIREIPANDCESVLRQAKTLFTQTMKGGEYGKIIEAIRKTASDDREPVLNHARTLITETMSGDECSAIIEAIRETAADDREPVLNHARTLITETMDGYECSAIIEAIRKTASDDRESVLNHARTLITETMNGQDCRKIIEAIREIPTDDREPVLRQAKTLITKTMRGRDYKRIIEAVKKSPDAARETIIKNLLRITDLNSVSSPTIAKMLEILMHMDQQDLDKLWIQLSYFERKVDSFQIFCWFYFIPLNVTETFVGDLKNQNKSKRDNYLYNFMDENADFKKEVFNYWHHLLLQPSEYRSRHLADFILSNLDRLKLYEAHFVVQEALQTRILLNNTQDQSNPYNFYRMTLEKRSVEVEVEKLKLPVEILEGVQVTLNPAYLKNMRPLTVRFADLPVINRQLLQNIDTDLTKRLGTNPKLEAEIQKNFAAPYSTLKAGALGSSLLQGLLDTQGDPKTFVPVIAAKMIAITNFLQTLETDVLPGQSLSLQEQTFLKVLASIQNCVTGKEEGIHFYYTNLPSSFKFRGLIEDGTLREKGSHWVNTLLRKEVEYLLSGTNLYLKNLIGIPVQAEIQQAAHQARYVKNVIGPDVGLSEAAAFDRYSRMIYQKLIDRSKQEMVQGFYCHLLPSHLLSSLLKTANSELFSEKGLLYSQLLSLIPEAHYKESWEINLQSEEVSLTEKGALLLLCHLGVFKTL